jgi:hypothetical protein
VYTVLAEHRAGGDLTYSEISEQQPTCPCRAQGDRRSRTRRDAHSSVGFTIQEEKSLVVQARFPRQHPALAEHRATGDPAQGGTHAAAGAYTVLAEHRTGGDLTCSEISEQQPTALAEQGKIYHLQ